jgi:nitrate reductase gamma subunit
MVVGGLAGLIAIIGLSVLIHRRLTDPRIRATSRRWDIAVILMLWAQLALGLLTVPVSARHMDGALFLTLVAYIKGIVLLHPGVADLLVGTPLIYRVHILLGFTVFLVSPFTRLVHIWSAPVWYLARPGFQVVRSRQSVGNQSRDQSLTVADLVAGANSAKPAGAKFPQSVTGN